MNIGILTQPLGYNYGGVLQNWALQKILEKLGHKPYTVVYYGFTPMQQFLHDTYSVISYIVKHLIFSPSRNIVSVPWDRKNPLENLYDFLNGRTRRTKAMSVVSQSSLKKYKLGLIVVGSDQVWRPRYNKKCLNVMFGDFGTPNCDIPIIAYAASFGVDKWEYSQEQTAMAQKLIKKFRLVSVREESAINLCERYLKVDAHKVLDPTMLLSRNEYSEMLNIASYSKAYKGKIGVYILDLNDNKKHLVEKVCEALNLEPKYFGIPDRNTGRYCEIESWLTAIDSSEYIITDSFHGTAFSINFNKPFVAISNTKRGNDRLISILNTFGLENRLIDEEANSLNESMLRGHIDWQKINQTLNELRKESTSKLSSALY